MNHYHHLLLACIAVLGSACAATQTGPGAKLDVLLTDAPGDFDAVWVEITAVEIEAANGWQALAAEPGSFDLLTLQNDVTAVLGGSTLAPGMYGQMRLIVDGGHVVINGASADLAIASGAQTGIKLNLDAQVDDQMTYTLVLDFDAAKSLHATGHGWLMTPVITVKEFSGTATPPTPAS